MTVRNGTGQIDIVGGGRNSATGQFNGRAFYAPPTSLGCDLDCIFVAAPEEFDLRGSLSCDTIYVSGATSWQASAVLVGETSLACDSIYQVGPLSGDLAATEVGDTAASSGSVFKTFLDPNRTAAKITLSNSNLTATKAA